MIVDAPALALARAGARRSPGTTESSARTLIGIPCRAIAAGDRLVAADVADREDQPAPLRRRAPIRRSSSTSMSGPARTARRLGPGRQAHQLDEVAPVVVVGAQRQPADARIVGRQPEDVPEVAVRPAALRRPERGRSPGRAGRRPSRARPAGTIASEPGRRLVADDGQTLDDAGAAAPASMRRLESALGRRTRRGASVERVGRRGHLRRGGRDLGLACRPACGSVRLAGASRSRPASRCPRRG